MVIPMFQTVK